MIKVHLMQDIEVCNPVIKRKAFIKIQSVDQDCIFKNVVAKNEDQFVGLQKAGFFFVCVFVVVFRSLAFWFVKSPRAPWSYISSSRADRERHTPRQYFARNS